MTAQQIWTPATRERITSFGGLAVKSPTQIRETHGRNITIMSRGGIGKTTLAATAVKSRFACPLLVLDIEGGSYVLDEDPNIDIISILTYDDWRKFYTSLKLNWNNPDKFPYKGICIDNITELMYKDLEVEKPKHKDPRQAYGVVTDDLLDITRFMRELTRKTMINVIINVWVERERDDDNNATFTKVQLNPATQKAYPGIVDIVGWLDIENDKPAYTRKLSFIPVRSDAKLRRAKGDVNAQKIPIEMWNPDLGAILDTLIGGDDFNAAQFAKPSMVAKLEAQREAAATKAATEEA